ncbi:hypothetical protein TW81_04350 [Vibrio galatheae]|uniref:Uncharacterized protein n=1 Tax=Vibrio galatheae TaxID=579748 RepID=A0A0F4NQQ1_9VIBR|nr:hypothetical protein [Vibrio galatheae]KJY84416.1 hypothetical protein TW81_04350 [Vibrio galatheae]
MAKRFCKMNRKQIADNLGEIHRLVVEPKYICRSCARSSASKNSLCKPAAIPPQVCQDKPAELQQNSALLAEALPAATSIAEQQKALAVRRVIDRVKQRAQQQKGELMLSQVPQITIDAVDLADKKSLKQAKKALKKHYKQQKKLIKLAKKQNKLMQKQKKLEAKVERINLSSEGGELQLTSNLH